MAKGNLILDKDLRSLFANLPDEAAGQLIKAAFACHDGESVTIDDTVLGAVYALIENKVLENDRKYEQRCEQNARNRQQAQTTEDEQERPSTIVDDGQPSGSNKNKNKKEKEKEKEKENIKETIVSSYAEPPAPVEAIPLNDGTEWRPPLELYEEYVRLFPGVDVPSAFRAMRAWSLSNVSQRKTKTGVSRFVRAWLQREQDRPRQQVRDQQRRKVGGFEMSDIERLVVNR